MNKTLAHFIWIGNSSIPSTYMEYLNSFYKFHPNWTINIWNLKDVDSIISKSKFDFNKYTSFINRYNFIKYHILAEYGGWYIDLDILWKKSIDQIYTDKIKNKPFPDLFIPVRSYPRQKQVDIKTNDDMLIYSRQGLFYELLEFIDKRTDLDLSKKYEPYGPISLSKWVHSTDYSRVYLYESEIQQNGYYCHHIGNTGWKFN